MIETFNPADLRVEYVNRGLIILHVPTLRMFGLKSYAEHTGMAHTTLRQRLARLGPFTHEMRDQWVDALCRPVRPRSDRPAEPVLSSDQLHQMVDDL